jgi:hypothetical protein
MLSQWLKIDAKQPLVVFGPRGAGKSTLIAHVVDRRPNVVHINVRTLLEKKEDLMVRGCGLHPGRLFSHVAASIIPPSCSCAHVRTGARPPQGRTR